jgi:hypothetical protein
MKAGVLGLVISVVAFAGSSVYLWQQLREQRALGAEVTAANEALKARLAELERRGGGWNRLAQADIHGNAKLAGPRGEVVATLPAPPADSNAHGAATQPLKSFRTEPTPAMQRMMRNQMRANHRRMYGDFVKQMGWSSDQANEFYDLLTDQWSSPGMFGDTDPEQHRLKAEEHHRKMQAKLNDLLGSQNRQAWDDYQQTLAARGEVDMLARQLEGVDLVLSADQRQKLVGALAEEQKRVPQPDYSNYGDADLYTKAMAEWHADYAERTAQRARGILDADQTAAFDEYQQWQKEMREQFTAMPGVRMGPTGIAPMRGNLMYNSGHTVTVSGGVATAAPVVISETTKK